MSYDDTAGGGCYNYTGMHLTYSPHFLEENPCGLSEGVSPYNYKYYGKYGASSLTGIFTYIGIEVNAAEDVDYKKIECLGMTPYARTELRAVKHVTASCTPFSKFYTEEDAKSVPASEITDDLDDGAFLKIYKQRSETEKLIKPANSEFSSEGETCGPYQQRTSDPDITSGLYKVCTRRQILDILGTSWSFAGLVMTAVSSFGKKSLRHFVLRLASFLRSSSSSCSRRRRWINHCRRCSRKPPTLVVRPLRNPASRSVSLLSS